MLRKPGFWLLLFLFAAAGGLLSVRYFPAAYPVVSLELEMDRRSALDAAAELAEHHRLAPVGPHRTAASFRHDRLAQMYVELEAGGATAFAQLLASGIYSPYTWEVRRFRPGETGETRIRFTPAGDPYGFIELLAEEEPGPGLEPGAARRLAESAAAEWQVSVAGLTLVEQSKETRIGGRVDHTLVYERQTAILGEARYRLHLVVSGDRLTELSHRLEVPEGFRRRFEEMRTANDVLSSGALLTAAVLYLVVGCLGGLFWLLRRGLVEWKAPLLWGLSIALLQLVAYFNLWPLAWMNYDTALSERTFVLQQVASQTVLFVGQGLLMGLSLMGAESLGRVAFPHHLQLWRVWSPRAAGSLPVLGQTAAAYLLVAVFFAYDIGLYLFSNHTLGWWTPSSPLFDPDVLAGYLPWLNPIAISLQAGFWEECLFRAVPLAGAALLGRRFGHRRAWIVAALLVQALVFGAGHANYPTMPAHARLVELFLPSIGFGLLYLAYGLLPAIVLHFAFDVVWTALPIFVASTPGVGLDRALVVALALVPLIMVARGRLRLGGWQPEPEDLRNREWSPQPRRAPATLIAVPKRTPMPASNRRALLAASALGLIAWGIGARFDTDAPALAVDRQGAVAAARQALAARGVELDSSWRALPAVLEPLDDQHRFVWLRGGRDRYQELLGNYLAPPQWVVRFVRFSGDVAERAEEYQVFLAGDAPPRIRHRLPESHPGSGPSEAEARGRALTAVKRQLQLAEYQIREVSAVEAKRPQRTDWELTFADERAYPLTEGEARIVVELAGNEIADLRRGVHVPEAWERAARERSSVETTTAVLAAGLLALLLVVGTLMAPVAAGRRRFPLRTLAVVFAGLAFLQLVDLANSWPQALAALSTARPPAPQLLLAAGFSGLFALLWAGGFALLFTVLAAARTPDLGDGTPRWAGLALGLAAAGLLTLAGRAAPPAEPLWGSYTSAGAYLPTLGTLTSWLDAFVVRGALVVLLFATVDRFTAGLTRRRSLGTAGLALAGVALAMATESHAPLPALVATALAYPLLLVGGYWVVLRYGLAPVAMATGVVTGLAALRAAWQALYPGAAAGALVAIVSIAALALVWERHLRGPQPDS